VEADRQRSHLPPAQQIRLVGPEMRLIQSVRPALEMSGELLDRVEIRRDGRGGEVTALELLQHDAATMGHKTLPVTHTLPGGSGAPHAERPPRQRVGPNAAGFTDGAWPISQSPGGGNGKSFDVIRFKENADETLWRLSPEGSC
jgi:hypothetical protein